MLIPHEFTNGEDADQRKYELKITYEAKPYHRLQGDQDLVIEASYNAGKGDEEPTLRKGKHVLLEQASRSFVELLPEFRDQADADGTDLAYLNENEFGNPRTITVEILTPGLYLNLHGPAAFSQQGPEIPRPDDAPDDVPYGGLLLKNINNQRGNTSEDPLAKLSDWDRENIHPKHGNHVEDNDFVRVDIHYNPTHDIDIPGIDSTFHFHLPENTRAFDEDGNDIAPEELNPEQATTKTTSIWVEGAPEFLTGTLRIDYRISGGRAGDSGVIEDVAHLHAVELDVTNSGTITDPEDGLSSYLPGYIGTEAQLHDPEKPFAELAYSGPQEMQLILPGAGHLAADFEITQTTSHPGFAVNAVSETLEGDNTEDFSFAADENKSQHTAGAGQGEDLKITIFCKDYGGSCEVHVTLRDAAQNVIGEGTIQLPVITLAESTTADTWRFAEAERWQALHPDTALTNSELLDPIDSEPQDPHETPGDALTVFEEYRGFILDGGRDENGAHDGGHRRLSVARKEYLVHVSMIPDLPAAGRPDAFMPGVATLYNHPDHGANLDIHWIVTEQGYPAAQDGPDLGPVIYHDAGFADRPHAYQHQQGGITYFIFHDSALQTSGEDDDNEQYALFYAAPPDNKAYVRASSLRRPNHVSPWFRHLMLFGQSGGINNFGGLRIENAKKAFYTASAPIEDRTAILLVESIAEEPGTLEANIHYAAAHELFHMLIEKRNAAPLWDAAEHLIGSASLMGDSPPPSNDPAARLAIGFDSGGIEKSAVDLKARQGLTVP